MICKRNPNLTVFFFFEKIKCFIFIVNRTCVNPLQSCNCDDISEAKWHSDEGYYMTPNSLGITQMVFLQQKDLAADALGRITLGPLECVETSRHSNGNFAVQQFFA